MTTAKTRPNGWHNGEYYCACGTTFGKNLKGGSPHALVRQHVDQCRAARGLFDILTATHLPNGAQILARLDDEGTWLVLCRWRTEYVTWFVDPDTGAAYRVRYCHDFADAQKDLLKRYNGPDA